MEREIAIVGFGHQGVPWALNLRDSGWKVHILLRPNSQKVDQVTAQRFTPETIERLGDFPILAILILDDAMGIFYDDYGKFLNPGQSLIFAHGFTLHYRTAPWPKNNNWILVSPQSIGSQVRESFIQGNGVPSILPVENDSTTTAWEIAKQVALGIGSEKAGIYFSTVKEEVEANLFSEQVLFYGGLVPLMLQAYDVMVQNDIKPEVAYLECVAPLAFITHLFKKRGLHDTLEEASPTARYGGFMTSPRLISPPVRKKLEQILKDIQNGIFKDKLAVEARLGYPTIHSAMKTLQKHSFEKVGQEIRTKMNGRSSTK